MIENVGKVSAGKSRAQPRPSRPSWRTRFAHAGYWIIVLALVGLNGRKYWKDAQPAPELRIAARLLEQGKTEEAEVTVRALIQESPHYGEARLLLARVLGNRGAFAECAEVLKGVPFWSAVKTEALWHEANSWLKADHAKDSEDAFRRYLTDDPNHPARPRRVEAEIALINLLSLQNRWEETRDLIWGAIKNAKGRGREELLVMSLRTFLERSSPKASYETVGRFVAADPTDIEARIALATAANGIGKTEEADEQIAVCLKARPEDPKVWKAWLELLRDRSDAKAITAALVKAPKSLENVVLPFRAFAFLQEEDTTAAADAYEQAVANHPHDPDLQYRLALAARRAGRTEIEARASLRSRALRKSREELSDSLLIFVRDFRSLDAPPADRATAMNRLAKLCEELGLSRDAMEWTRLGKEVASS